MTELPKTCTDVEAHVPLFVGRDLDPPVLEAVERHLERCAPCRLAVAAAERAREAFLSLAEPIGAPINAIGGSQTSLWPAVAEMIASESLASAQSQPEERISGPRQAPILSFSRYARFAAAAAFIVVGSWFASRFFQPAVIPMDPAGQSGGGSSFAVPGVPGAVVQGLTPVNQGGSSGLRLLGLDETRFSDTAVEFPLETRPMQRVLSPTPGFGPARNGGAVPVSNSWVRSARRGVVY